MALFNASEVVGFALRIERNGESFYETLAGLAEDADTRDVFTFLANEERRHIVTFTKLQDSVGEYEPTAESYPGEYESYVRALVDETVFTKERIGELMARRVSSEMEAIETAIGFEKDSIIFYNEMLNFVPESEYSVVDNVIAEEKNHVKKLAELKRKIGKSVS